MTDLLVGLAFTIGTFFVLLLLYFVYYFQDKRTGIKAILYRYAIIVNAILIISELISSYLLYDKLSPVLGEILLKFHWYTGVAYFYFFYFYADAHLKNIDNINLKDFLLKRKEGKIISVITLIFSLLFFIVQFKDLDYHALSYLPGWPAYIVFAYAVIIVMITFIKYIKKKDKTKNEKIFIVLFLLAPTVDLGLQIIWVTVAFSPTFMAFLLLGCYFLLENPDLYVANELEKTKKGLETSSTHKKYILSLNTNNDLNKIAKINMQLYNAVNSNDLESSKVEVNNNINELYNVINLSQQIFNILEIEEDNTKIYEREYNTLSLLTKLYYGTIKRIKNENVKLIFDIDPFLPITLFGDDNIIYKVLEISLNTAISNTSVGKITLKIKCSFVNNKVLLNIDIIDTSNGLREDVLAKINSNEADDAVDVPIIEDYFITKKYLTYIGGSYNVSSTYAAGTTVSINFEQKVINQSKIDEIKFDECNYNINISNRKILVVDNNILEIKNYLDKYHANYEIVSSYEECINKLKLDDTITTIFINPTININNENMAKTLKSIMTMHQDTKNKVFAISSDSLSKTKKKYILEEYDDCIGKPINEYDFNEIIKKI